MGCELIQLKLVNIATDQFSQPLTCIINSAISQSIFPNKIKKASATQPRLILERQASHEV